MRKITKRHIAGILCVILAILCMIYGLKVYSLGYGTAFFLIWIILGAFLLFVAWSIQVRLWGKLPKWLRRTLLAVAGLGLSLFVFVEGCILSGIHAEGREDLDYIIVLGAMVKEDGPSSILAARLNCALRYLEENPDTIVIVSGGQGKDEPFSEAEGMRQYLVEHGVDEARILMEPDSFNTVQNIQNSMKLIEKENPSVGIVTSNFHVFRACRIAQKQGLEDVDGLAGYVVPAYMPQNMFREFFGIVKDWLVGNM